MTNVNISPFRVKPLDEHTLGHVLSEMTDQVRDDGPLDRAGWREILLGVGYPRAHVHQILDRWFVKCHACGDRDATHLWATIDCGGTIGSMAGPGRFAPSCDQCSGPISEFADPQQGVIRVPLDFDPEWWTALVFGDHPARVAEWLRTRQPDTLSRVINAMDPGDARDMLTVAIGKLARKVSDSSNQVDFDTVLLDIITEARTF